MKTEPFIETRPEQTYVGVGAVIPMSDFSRQIPALFAKVAGCLAAHGLTAAGKPFLRYHVIDMPDRMDIELGIAVNFRPQSTSSVQFHVLPAGRYAVLQYVGVTNSIAANKKLIDWIAAQGEEVVSHPSEDGEVFKARYETFLTDTKRDPDQGNWETEVAIKLREPKRAPGR